MNASAMSAQVAPRPLAGLSVVEIAGGAAAAYCTRLLADAGARVTVLAAQAADRERGIVRRDVTATRSGGAAVEGADEDGGDASDEDADDALYAAYLAAGKTIGPDGQDAGALARACAAADLVVIGESSSFVATQARPRVATIALDWFGRRGERADWQGSDLIVQALTGLPQMAGRTEGPPIWFGDRQSVLVAGVTAFIAALAAVLAPRPASSGAGGSESGPPPVFDVGILEANIVLSEMHMHFFERDGIRMARHGLNRFAPNSPVGVYRCADGWVGITATTPDQWKSLCVALDMRALGADASLVTRELRFGRLDEVERAMNDALAARTAVEWAAIGRRYKVPIVVVPDAQGILAHPIFGERCSLAAFTQRGRRWRVPRTPFSLTATPVASDLDAMPVPAVAGDPSPAGRVGQAEAIGTGTGTGDGDADPPPLHGLTVIDFAMGWAGPLASRLLADLGADVLKIEAGRYPDWWRGVNWTAEFIEGRQYENAKGFCALNRGKRGLSIDLTDERGRALALSLIAGADAVVENQAAGVMAKLGLGYERLREVRPDLVMLSMSAFGTGNAWSDTRAYGSTLEQGAGLPHFMGFPDDVPTMAHLAYGDPIGGLYGCAALLTALVHRRRTGEGQLINLSMVETILQFTTPALLAHQRDPTTPLRRGNRHAAFAPHGIHRAAGDDRWLAVAVADRIAFGQLARIIGREDWATDPRFATRAGRHRHDDEIAAAIAAWAAGHDADQAAHRLQAAGVAAAPIAHADEIADDRHLAANDFFIDLVRAFSGPQRQGGIAIRRDGRRLGSRRPAPLLGEHSWAVLSERLGMDRADYDRLVRDQVITFGPTTVRNAVKPSDPAR